MKGKYQAKKNNKRLKKERSVSVAKTEIVNKIIEQIKEVLEDCRKQGLYRWFRRHYQGHISVNIG